VGLRASLWKDDLNQFELKPSLAVSTQTPLRTAVEMMQEASSGYLLVCDDGQLQGIFTERDLVKRVLTQGVGFDEPIGPYMTTNPMTIRRSDSVGWAIRTMHQGHYRHLPVVDEERRPVGVLSVKNIVHYLVEHVPSAVYNLPPEPGRVHGAREGA
jgi:CBS domain-containing protein